MPFYTFRINSTERNVLTKTFTTQDYFDLHYLLAGQDYTGVDLFCQQKFEEYTKDKTKLNCFDKFLYLFSQKVVSHESEISIVHTVEQGEKLNKLISLAKIYNDICDLKYQLKNTFEEGNLKLEVGVPVNLSDKRRLVIYSLQVNDLVINDTDRAEISSLSFLPVGLYRKILKMQLSNNNALNTLYFKECFLRDFTFDTECFLYILNFVYNENVSNFYDLTYKLNKDYSVNYSYMCTLTMRELYLLVETINKSVQEKKNKEKTYE